MADLDDMKEELGQLRDEIKLKMHLASMEAKEEWADLEKKWDNFNANAKLAQSGEDISGALALLGGELREAFNRFKKAL